MSGSSGQVAAEGAVVSKRPGLSQGFDWVPLLGMAPAWIALAWVISKAKWFWSNNPDLQFGWIVVMLVAYLLWETWEKRPAVVFRAGLTWFAAASVGAIFLFLTQVYQSAYGMTPASMSGLAIGMLLVAFANLGYVFGWKGVTSFGFPFVFFLIALPVPSAIYNPLVGSLQSLVTTINVEVLNLLGIGARRVGSLIHLSTGTVGVDEACSGIRSLQSTVMATLFIGYLTLRHKTSQVLLFVLGIGLAVFGNVLRSLYLSVTANSKGLEAIDKVHDSAGWTILLFTAGGVALFAWALSKVEKGAGERMK